MALQFPDKEQNGVTPIEDTHREDNGITYYWDPISSSWVIVSAQTVTKDYVDNRDELRYRRDGSDFIYGNVVIRRRADFVIDPSIVLTNTGSILLDEDNKILFSSESENTPSISYGIPGNEEVIISFDSSFILPKKPFRYSTNSGSRVFLVENDGVGELELFDVQNASGVSYTKNVIRIPNDKNSSLVITGDSTTVEGLFVKGNSHVEIVNDTGLLVRNHGVMSDNKAALRVVSSSHKVFVSTEYNEGLMTGSGRVTDKSGGSTFYTFTEPNLVATKAYVDHKSQVAPGFTVIADHEEEAQPGGFWRAGSNLYWKL